VIADHPSLVGGNHTTVVPSASDHALTHEGAPGTAGTGVTKPQAAFDAHLAGCEACRELVAGLAQQQLHWVVGIPEDALADRDLLALAVVDPIVFEMSEELARGGMGRVAKARDRRLGRDVAIKEVLSATLDARFAREVAITAQLQHPAIVPIYEAGRWPDGSAFYAMRLVSGGTLAAAIAKTETLEDRLALLPHVIALTDALAYAHANRIIHRDLKPGNVLVGEFGETVVIDWGLAKDLSMPSLTDAPPCHRWYRRRPRRTTTRTDESRATLESCAG